MTDTIVTGSTSDDITFHHPAYDRMYQHWKLPDTLLGGTRAMRDAETTYLPKEDKEQHTAYLNRLSRSFLFNGYKSALKTITTRPFTKPVTVNDADQLPEILRKMEDDVDGNGTSLSAFARQLMFDGVHYGKCHALVDFPATGGQQSLRDEKTGAVRPLFNKIKPDQVMNWGVELDDRGVAVLSFVVIHETVVEQQGDFQSVEVEQYRYISKSEWRVYRKTAADSKSKVNSKWSVYQEGTHTFGAVPLFTCYFDYVGMMEAYPVLEDLAYTNLNHWQSASDQANILRFARTGILTISGLSEEEMKKTIVVGPNQVLKLENPESKAYYTEHTGEAIGAGRDDLKDLEEKMQIQGMQPFITRNSSAATATGQLIDEGRSMSDVESWARALEDMLYEMFVGANTWLSRGDKEKARASLPEEFKIDITTDVAAFIKSQEDLKALLELRKLGDLSRESLWSEYRRRNILSESFNEEEEIARLEEEEADTIKPAMDVPPATSSSSGETEPAPQPTEAEMEQFNTVQ